MIARLRKVVGSANKGGQGDRGKAWSRFSITALEADMAYFQARLELIGEPDTINKKAQVETFRYLVDAMGRILSRLKRRQPPAK